MIRILDLASFDLSMIERQGSQQQDIEETVRDILRNVRQRKDVALGEYTRRFDGVDGSDFRISESEIQGAISRMDPALIDVLERAADNIRAFHRMQIRTGFTMQGADGITMGQRFTPLQRVGIYIPGGTAAYPSTVLMDCIPAIIAGVDRIVLATPPARDGGGNAAILAAAHIAGVGEIYRVGGAQAIAAMAYGTETVPRVDKIVGPGNIYVAMAKKMVYGIVDIDMIAGPSDILILADDTAIPAFVAADLLAQAEHDVLSRAILLTTSRKMAENVRDELKKQCDLLSRAHIAKKSIEQYGVIVICDTIGQAVALSDTIAPEHLEICTENADDVMALVRNAGSIFLGNYTPEALGDYFAGPNHTLPTEGTSRFFSPLSVDDFVKKSSFLSYSRQALVKAAQPVMAFAHAEQLQAHARSIEIRL